MKLTNRIGRDIQVQVTDGIGGSVGEEATLVDNGTVVVRDVQRLNVDGDQSGDLVAVLAVRANVTLADHQFLHDGGTGAGNLDDDSNSDGEMDAGGGQRTLRVFNLTGTVLASRRDDVDIEIPPSLDLSVGNVTRVEVELVDENGDVVVVVDRV